jgi:hypothetical protein
MVPLGARKTHACLFDEEDRNLPDLKIYNDFECMEVALRPDKSSLKVVAEPDINISEIFSV